MLFNRVKHEVRAEAAHVARAFAANELRALMCDINTEEIMSHVRSGDLEMWLKAWQGAVEWTIRTCLE